MLFNSIEFLIFFPIVLVLYWLLRQHFKIQNILLVFSSYVFYGWWDYRFLSLIFISTIVDYFTALRVERSTQGSMRKFWVGVSIAFNLGVLLFFKYYNFFIESWINAFESIGYSMDIKTMSIILPVGISFYTFQTMSYTIDVYNKRLTATRDFVAFTAFVSFFPQLVAGPIERAKHLLPQMLKKRVFNYAEAVDGLRLILWGGFKKVVIADACAPIVNDVFSRYQSYSPSALIIGALLFSVQIYCDFSGYTDIARGLSKLMGFDIMINFNFPYFSRNIGEFWRRWHISLSTWFRDYLYIPLGGSRGSSFKVIRNIFIVFLVSGLWHGANWTFVAWGGIHALLFIPIYLVGANRKYVDNLVQDNSIQKAFKELPLIVITFVCVTFAWIFFRADNIEMAFGYIRGLALFSSGQSMSISPLLIVTLIIFIIVDFFKMMNTKMVDNMVVDCLLLFCVLYLRSVSQVDFIYFQF